MVAESPAVKLRLGRELAARLLSTGREEQATKILTQTATQLPADLKPAVAELQKHVDGAKAAKASLAQALETAARAEYLKTLRISREQAAAANETENVNRYDRLISEAGGG